MKPLRSRARSGRSAATAPASARQGRAAQSVADRVHLIAPANPPAKDVLRFEFDSLDDWLGCAAGTLPAPLRLTHNRALLDTIEQPARGGRRDDDARVRDLQGALGDPRTAAIIASSGGAYLSRILPRLDLSPLDARGRGAAPLTVVGFSELTGLVNLAAFSRGGRGIYWLCPNYLAWKLAPPARSRAAFAEFWQCIPRLIELDPRLWGPFGPPGRAMLEDEKSTRNIAALLARPLRAELVQGRLRSGAVRLVGGCLSVLAALLPGRFFQRVKPDGRWLVLEDVGEAPHRIDRHLAALQFAGWFERCAGVLIGDFHTSDDADQRGAVVEFLRYHLRGRRDLPIAITRDFGHVWPMLPLPLNQELPLTVRRKELTLDLR